MKAITTAAAVVTETASFKVGINKGNPRIWFDGARLDRFGFRAGMPFRIEFPADGSLVIHADAYGERKVAGKRVGDALKPIIDLNHRALGEWTRGAERIEATFALGKITIIRSK